MEVQIAGSIPFLSVFCFSLLDYRYFELLGKSLSAENSHGINASHSDIILREDKDLRRTFPVSTRKIGLPSSARSFTVSSTRGNSRRLVSFSAAASPQGKDRLSLLGQNHALNSGCRLRVAGWRRGIGGLGFEWSSYMPRSLRTCLIRYLETGTRRLTGEFCLVEPGFTPKQATSEYRSSPLFLSGGKIALFPLPRRENVRK